MVETLALIAAIGSSALAWGVSRRAKINLERRVRAELEDFQLEFRAHKQKFNQIQAEAVGYFNSLGGRCVKSLYEIQRMFAQVEQVAAYLERLLSEETIASLTVAEQILSTLDGRPLGGAPQEAAARLQRWSTKIELKIASVRLFLEQAKSARRSMLRSAANAS